MEFQVICCPPETSCESYYDHDCSEYYNETDLMKNVRKGCHIMESCNDSRYCANFVNREEPYIGTEMNYFGVCNPNHECQLRCENDNDCIGEDEYCHKTEKTCYNYKNYSDCFGTISQMYDMVCESEFCYFLAATQECVDYCTDDEQCPEPVSKCDNSEGNDDGNCVLPCSIDQECVDYKWSGGRYCDVKKGYCTNGIWCSSDDDCSGLRSKCYTNSSICVVPCTDSNDCINTSTKRCSTEKGHCVFD